MVNKYFYMLIQINIIIFKLSHCYSIIHKPVNFFFQWKFNHNIFSSLSKITLEILMPVHNGAKI